MGGAEGEGDGLPLLEVLVEADHQEGGGEVVYCPEGADHVGGTGEDEAAGEADIFIGGGGDVGDAGFAGGKGDERRQLPRSRRRTSSRVRHFCRSRNLPFLKGR